MPPGQPGYGPPSGGFPGQQQPGGFPGQPGGYPGQPFPSQPVGYAGYPGGPGGPAKNKALPWILAGSGVVVIGVVVVLLFVFGVFGGSGGSTDSPDQLAQKVANVVSTQDEQAAAAISCNGAAAVTNNGQLQQVKGIKVQATVTGNAQVSGSTATATIHLSFQQSGHSIEMDGKLSMQQQNGKWCVPNNGFNPDNSTIKVDGQSAGSGFGSGGSGSSGSSGGSGLPGDGSSLPSN
jgi:hypothetical protein